MMRFVTMLFIAAGLLVMSGCGEADERIDCGQVCQAYDECQVDIDGTTCADVCEDAVDTGALAESSVDLCEECVERMSCSEQDPCWAAGGDCSNFRAWVESQGF